MYNEKDTGIIKEKRKDNKRDGIYSERDDTGEISEMVSSMCKEKLQVS